MSNHIVYRLYPDFGRCSGLVLEDSSAARLLARLAGQSDSLDEVKVEWIDNPSGPHGDFPCGLKSAPILSQKICDHFHEQLFRSGKLIPVSGEHLREGEYWLLFVEALVDCLDARRSTKPKKHTGEMQRPIFFGEKLDLSLPAFRIPESPRFVFWNRPFVEALKDFGAKAMSTMIVWAEDPTIKPAARPMV